MTRVAFRELLSEPVRNGVYKPKEFHGSGVKIVNMKELFAHDVLRDEPTQRVELTQVELAKAELRDGDLLFARRSFVLEGAGKCSLVTEPTEPMTFESSMIRARPDRSRADPRFLYYYFRSAIGRDLMATIAARTAVSGITGSNLSRLLLDVPSIGSQEKVSKVLECFDGLIDSNRQRVALLEETARSVHREWFVRFRYSRHGAGPGSESAGRTLPLGWAVRKLFEVADVGFGFSYKSPAFGASGPFQVIRIRDVPAGLSSTFTDEAADARYAVHDDDVLIGMDGDFHMNVWTGGDAWLNQRVARLRPSIAMSPLHLLLAIEDQIAEWNRSIVGTTVAHLGKRHLERVKVVVPDPRTLAAASEVFDSIMGERRALTQASRALAGLRDLLLPKLVTGQIDVSTLDLDALIEEQVS